MKFGKTGHGTLALAVIAAQVSCWAQGLTAEQVLRAITRGEAAAWPGLSADQRALVREKAESYLARYQAAHQPHGFTAEVLWTDRERSSVERYEGLGDGVTWTGHYLAALALRQSVEPSGETLDEIVDVLARFDALISMTGRDGYMPRYAGPADDPAYEPYYSQYGRGPSLFRPGLGTRAYRGVAPYDDLVWLGNSSRDTYDGVHFGLAAVWEYVDDEEVRARVKAFAIRIGRRLEADRFFVLDGRGHVTRPTLQWRCAWLRLLLSVAPEEFRQLRVRYAITSKVFRRVGFSLRPVWTNDYFPSNLNMIRMFTLCTLEDDPDVRAEYQAMLREEYHREAATHLNAHFAAIYLLATGDNDLIAKATIEGCLLDFPDEKWADPVDNRELHGVEMRDDRFAQYAFIPSERPNNDFLWQRPPALAVCTLDGPREYPGIDMFLPYWMARAAGMLAGE